jgi:4-hydroxyphenylpyruvate dioxygenase
VQHIALITGDICATVDELKRRELRFLSVPRECYADLWERVGEIQEDISEIERLNIMDDRDDEGHRLQIFTEPVEDCPTLFFGAIERQQARRGNL